MSAPVKVHVVIGQGGEGDGSLMANAGLSIEAVFTDQGEAYRYESMGDMETYTLTLNVPRGEEAELNQLPPGTGVDLNAALDSIEVEGDAARVIALRIAAGKSPDWDEVSALAQAYIILTQDRPVGEE